MVYFDSKQLQSYPEESGVYLMKGARDEVLYVGKAKNIKKRLKQYFSLTDTRAMIPHLIAQIKSIETLVVASEKEALLLENTLIKKHRPKYNAILKDDKTYACLMLNTSHPWPRLSLVRFKGKPKQKGLYFGPYTSALAARQVFDLLTRLFPLRQCSDHELASRKRPCILYGIKRCIAPCVNLCSKEEYANFVQSTIDFLKGKDRRVVEEITQKMLEASNKLEFEQAAAYHRTLVQIEHVIKSHHTVIHFGTKDCDALALHRTHQEALIMQLIFREGRLTGSEHYTFENVLEDDEALLTTFLLQLYLKTPPPPEILLTHLPSQASSIEEILRDAYNRKIELFSPKRGEKRALTELAAKNSRIAFEKERGQKEVLEKILLDLVDACKLIRFPKRIECFDTSHIAGADLVATMVAFTEGQRELKRTRTFILKGIDKGDDYAALHQTLTRRLLRAKEEDDLPDLLLIDGGKGQLNIARDVLRELDITTVDAISLCKERGKHDKGLRKERIYTLHRDDPLALPPDSPLLFFLQQIRDSTHEKALSFHHKRRTKGVVSTALDRIEGIGPIKRKRLLTRFGSIERIRKASDEELLAVQGIKRKDVERLRAFTF